ncbi:MAG: MFS transporter [Deltaproteobacteria bacterium]|nr:MFS transporter [Candidatus Zymogenaceae bacterium]
MAEQFEKKLSNKEVFFYNWGSISLNFVEGVLFTWIMYFLAPPEESGNIAYIPIIWTGIILTAGRVFDAITDPLIGNFSDNFQSRWGRRKPFIIFGTPVMIIAFIFLWTPPVEGVSNLNIIYLAVIFTIYFLFYTAIGIPYDALLAEIALTSDDRVKLTSWKLVYAIIGFLLVALIAPGLYQNMGPFKMALVVGAIGLVTMYMCLPGVKELPREFSQADVKMSVWDSLKNTFGNKQFLAFGLAIIALYMCYEVLLVVIPYFVTVVLQREEAFVMYLQAEFILCMVASIPLWMWLAKKYSKRTLLRAISIALSPLFAIIFFVGAVPGVSVITQAFVLFPLVSIPLGGFMILVYAMMGDVVDYDQMKTGKRREAMYYGVFGFSRKVGFALSTIILPLLFKNFGYGVGNDLGIRLVWIMLGITSLIGFFILFGYKLGDSPEETKKIMGEK